MMFYNLTDFHIFFMFSTISRS
uniref:Uncharacterized protein n=1 Tax=Anguilla anguilla TaxID=7936 RepID=A0A0E9TEM1_ANGAN